MSSTNSTQTVNHCQYIFEEISCNLICRADRELNSADRTLKLAIIDVISPLRRCAITFGPKYCDNGASLGKTIHIVLKLRRLRFRSYDIFSSTTAMTRIHVLPPNSAWMRSKSGHVIYVSAISRMHVSFILAPLFIVLRRRKTALTFG